LLLNVGAYKWNQVFLLYTNLQQGASNLGTFQGYRGLGYVDSRQTTLTIQFDLKAPASSFDDDGELKKGRGAKRKRKVLVQDKVVDIQLMQDTTALRTRKGDTGSVLWMAR
jgi:hypothetical protein